MSDLARRERIAVALKAAIESGCPDVPIVRNRRTAVDASEAPLLVLRDGGHTADQDSAIDTAYQMQISVEGTVTAGDDELLGPVVNALYLAVVRSLGPDLGGECQQVRETGFDVAFAPAEESPLPLADFTLDLVIDFHTPDGDPAG